jgi:hypothetical protein
LSLKSHITLNVKPSHVSGILELIGKRPPTFVSLQYQDCINRVVQASGFSSIPYATSEKDRDRRLRCHRILAYPLDSLDSRPRWNKAFDNGSVRAILLERPNAWRPSPERVNRLMNSTLNGSRLRKTWVLWSGFMSLNLDRGDVTNVGLINLWMSVLRTCRHAT